MSASTVTVRLVLTVFAIACSAVLLRGQLSSALVTRGDAFAYWGERDEARVMYARALFFDERNRVAADRYVFDAALSKKELVVRNGVAVANAYLARVPDDAAVLMDRAMCYQREGSLRSAIADFERAGRYQADPRALMFAALDERALGHRLRARVLLRAATALDHHFAPARLELART